MAGQIFFGKKEACMFKLSSYSSMPKEIFPYIPQQQHKYATTLVASNLFEQHEGLI